MIDAYLCRLAGIIFAGIIANAVFPEQGPAWLFTLIFLMTMAFMLTQTDNDR